jgi:hypothetical protein
VRALMTRVERLEGRAPAPAAPVHRPEEPATAAARAAREQAPAGPSHDGPTAEAPAIVAASADIEGAPPVTAVTVVEPHGPVPEPEVRLDLPGVTEMWPAVLADLEERSPVLYAAMQNARPSSLTGGELTLSWAESAAFSKRKAEDPAYRDQIAVAIRSVTGTSLRVAYELAEEEVGTAPPELSDEELVDAFMREFDAEELPAEEES